MLMRGTVLADMQMMGRQLTWTMQTWRTRYVMLLRTMRTMTASRDLQTPLPPMALPCFQTTSRLQHLWYVAFSPGFLGILHTVLLVMSHLSHLTAILCRYGKPGPQVACIREPE